MKMLTTITLRGSHKLLRVGSIRSPAALPRMAVRGRAFLSEQPTIFGFAITRVGKAKRAHLRVHRSWKVGTLPPSLVELRRTQSLCPPYKPRQSYFGDQL